VDRFLIKLPGNILQSLYYARFARAMEVPSARDSGADGVEARAQSIGNRALETTFSVPQKKSPRGRRWLHPCRGFPPVFVQLVATGEKTGRLADT